MSVGSNKGKFLPSSLKHLSRIAGSNHIKFYSPELSFLIFAYYIVKKELHLFSQLITSRFASKSVVGPLREFNARKALKKIQRS